MELDFTDELLEKLTAKKALLDKNWTNIVSKIYDKRWFSNYDIKLIIGLEIKYYKTHSSIPSNKLLLAYIDKFIQNQNIDSTTVDSVAKTLDEIQKIDLQAPDDVIDSNIKGFIKRKVFKLSLEDNAMRLAQHSSDFENVVDKCLDDFERVSKITFNDTDLGLDYFNPTAMDKHWQYIRNPEAKIKTGWMSLDSYTNGGFLKDGRSLYLVMAQAGLGKSVFLSNMAVNFLKQGLSVVVISLEMSEDVYAVRFDSHISEHNINHLKENEESAISRIKEFYNQHPTSNLYIKEYPPKSITCNDIQAYLENLKNSGHKFDVVIVDYLNLVRSQKTSDNMFQDGLDVSEKLRALSYEFKVPVISACQVNSEGMNNENVGMENISQSRGVAFTADFLMALYQTQDDRNNGGIIHGRLIKNRLGGQVGTVMNFQMDSNTLVVTDLANDIAINDDSEINTSSNDKLKGIMKDLTISSDISNL